jgi:hypothetical protein
MDISDNLRTYSEYVKRFDSLARNIRQPMFGGDNLRDFGEIALIVSKCRKDLPKHYEPFVDLLQGGLDFIAGYVEKPKLWDCVRSYEAG